MTPESFLPAELRGATLEKIAVGLSGAGVYKVQAPDAAYVLKIYEAPVAVATREAAAAAGVAPKVIYVDPTKRAVLSELVVDRGFMSIWMNPATRAHAVASLGGALRRVHDLPLDPGAAPADPRGHLEKLATTLADRDVPAIVREAQERALAEPLPPAERTLVTSHNDVNPSNLVWDGERVILLDWDTASPNDPLYDLAAVATFLRMDADTCRALLAAHDGIEPAAMPARFAYWRRTIATMCGSMFLMLARRGGYTGSADGPTLAEAYAEMRAGTLAVSSGEGQWRFGLALIRESLVL